jgi:hypothetical protein
MDHRVPAHVRNGPPLVLADFQTLSIGLWFPIMLVEASVLLVVVKRIEEKFTGRHETLKLDF